MRGSDLSDTWARRVRSTPAWAQGSRLGRISGNGSLQHGNGAAGDTHTKRQCLSSVTLLLTCTASPSATKNISSRLYDRIGFTGSDFSARERGQRFERFATELSACCNRSRESSIEIKNLSQESQINGRLETQHERSK
ncbi:hypothetical protein RRG08_013551 [Elysia crispata]|uniref:Uncharacterized protein n=1 Tax=Elysia crispata TaxID=231223 RepID=A0AAE0Y155_9GAST|nr:hypothetical protein RRG08_013551 [Elysia crispata]